MSTFASQPLPLDDSDSDEAASHASGQEPVRWEVVAETMGILQARIIADRLQADGIPARAWQESVGQAYGMIVGPLGTGYVSVPEAYVDEALAILAESEQPNADADPDDDDETFDRGE